MIMLENGKTKQLTNQKRRSDFKAPSADYLPRLPQKFFACKQLKKHSLGCSEALRAEPR